MTIDEALRSIAAFGEPFGIEGADALADELERQTTIDDERLVVLDALAGQHARAASYIRARLLAAWGRVDEAIASITRAIDGAATIEPPLLATRARWLTRRDRFSEAARDLTLALNAHPPCSFYLRTEKLLQKVAASSGFKPRRQARLALLSSSTTGLLVPVLRAAFFARGIAVDIYEGAYGNYVQEILDPESGLYRFRPEQVLLLVNARDLDLPPAGGRERVDDFCTQLRSLWTALQSRNPCHIVQVGVEPPKGGAWGSLEDVHPEGRRRMYRRVDELLSGDLPAGVSFLEVTALGALFSAEDWHRAKQFPRTEMLPLFADAVCAQFRAALGLSSKVLVLDLDNTLWGGVIGEDGLDGIRIGSSTPEGEAYRDLQRYAKELQQRGVVLAVCSKNNRADAEAPFRSHPDMVLRLDDFVAFRASWDDKVTGLRAIAEELSLGLDSFVFLDDNPVERGWVRANLPEVIVPEAGATPWSLLAALQRGLYFEAIALTSEDLDRKNSYQSVAALRTAQNEGVPLEEFLRGLGMTAQHGPVDASSVTRVTQLINKTNQFNLTTRRYGAEQVARMADSSQWWCRWFRLTDRFGDHGLIGVLLARIETETWFIDTWLMSCRVLGRRMEEFMCRQLLDAAVRAGARQVVGEYIPSGKNGMVADLYPRLGFVADAKEGLFRFELGVHPLPTAPWIAGREVLPTG